jgi:hypothetical protein
VDSRYHRLVPNHASIGQRVRSISIDRTGCRPFAHFHVRWIRRSSEMMRLFVFGCNGMGFAASTTRFSTGVRQVNNLIGILHVAIRKRRMQSGGQPCAWGNLSTLCPCAVSDELHLGGTPYGAWRWLFSRHVSGVGHGGWASRSKSDRAHTGFWPQHVLLKAQSELYSERSGINLALARSEATTGMAKIVARRAVGAYALRRRARCGKPRYSDSQDSPCAPMVWLPPPTCPQPGVDSAFGYSGGGRLAFRSGKRGRCCARRWKTENR